MDDADLERLKSLSTSGSVVAVLGPDAAAVATRICELVSARLVADLNGADRTAVTVLVSDADSPLDFLHNHLPRYAATVGRSIDPLPVDVIVNTDPTFMPGVLTLHLDEGPTDRRLVASVSVREQPIR